MIRRATMRLRDGTELTTWSVAGRLQVTVAGTEVSCVLALAGVVLGLSVGAPEWPHVERDHRRIRGVLGPVGASVWRGNVSGGASAWLLGLLLPSPPSAPGLRWLSVHDRRSARRRRREAVPLGVPRGPR